MLCCRDNVRLDAGLWSRIAASVLRLHSLPSIVVLCLEQAMWKERFSALVSLPVPLKRALPLPIKAVAQGVTPASGAESRGPGKQLYLQSGNLPCARESSLLAQGQQKQSQFPSLHGGPGTRVSREALHLWPAAIPIFSGEFSFPGSLAAPPACLAEVQHI